MYRDVHPSIWTDEIGREVTQLATLRVSLVVVNTGTLVEIKVKRGALMKVALREQ